MQGFIQGADRQQTTLLPECLDDWVGEGNSIRAADVFVDALELRDLVLYEIFAGAGFRIMRAPSIDGTDSATSARFRPSVSSSEQTGCSGRRAPRGPHAP